MPRPGGQDCSMFEVRCSKFEFRTSSRGVARYACVDGAISRGKDVVHSAVPGVIRVTLLAFYRQVTVKEIQVTALNFFAVDTLHRSGVYFQLNPVAVYDVVQPVFGHPVGFKVQE